MADVPEPDGGEAVLADEETGPQEPEEATEPPKWRRPGQSYTIQSLRLDMAAARAGKTYLLLPFDVRGDYKMAEAYPIPSGISELAMVAELPIKRNSRHGGARYIRKARKAMLRRAPHLKAAAFDMSLAECEEKAVNVHKAAAAAQADIDAAVAGVRAEALRSVASMGDINEKLKQAADRIVTAFLADQPINGEPVSVKEMSDVIGKGWTHVARLGSGAIDSDGKAEAEGTVLAEFNKARADRLARQMQAADDPKEIKH